ncbi:MAG: HAD family hydrolase [Thermoleophilia bacterium]|nr:HAD family hydrolase [Thermoleophilia bacterium]
MSRLAPRGKPGLILATDLDGTLLGGSEDDRRRLTDTMEAEPSFQVIFLTGRNLETVRPYLDDPLVPTPAYIVSDVGATVVSGKDLKPIQPLQNELDRAWPGCTAVERVLRPFPFLERQDVPQERRCSYHIADERSITRELLLAVESIGCSALFSAGRYLDVLAEGVSKGTTLLKLIDLEKLDPASILVAGDSLNDLSMFETGLKGVVVGNGEAGLKQAVSEMSSVFVARRTGAGGLLQALCLTSPDAARALIAPQDTFEEPCRLT